MKRRIRRIERANKFFPMWGVKIAFFLSERKRGEKRCTLAARSRIESFFVKNAPESVHSLSLSLRLPPLSRSPLRPRALEASLPIELEIRRQ